MIKNQGSGMGYPCDFIVELGYLYFLPQMYLRVEKFVKSEENCSLSSPPIWLTQKSKSGKDIGLVCVLGG